MKNALYFASLLLLLGGCKKEDTSNRVAAPAADPPIVYSYLLTVINEAKNLDGDTIRVKLNDALLQVYTNTERFQYGPRVKTGDVLSIYYNPGKVQFNGNTITDDNDLKVYIDDKLLFEGNCRCTTNTSIVIK